MAAVLMIAACVVGQDATKHKEVLYQYEGTYEFSGGSRLTLGIFDEFKQL
jgi:hypothetical protein